MGVGKEEAALSMEAKKKELSENIKKLNLIPDKSPVEHCQCRTGCSECYGKLNCGCPDCYVPQLNMGKRKKVSLELMEMRSLPGIPELHYNTVTISHVTEHWGKVTKTTVKAEEDPVRRRSCADGDVSRRPDSCMLNYHHQISRKRWSMPVMETVIKEKEKPRRNRTREIFEARDVAPPKQVKYFCKNCDLDVCNQCFRTVCSSHLVQWIGSACFHCASPFHKIVHQNESNEWQ